MKNLIIAALVIGGLAYGGAKFYLHHKVSESMDSVVIQMAPFADITYDGVSSSMSGELTVDGINARISGFNDALRIDKMGIDTAHFLALLRLGDIVSDGRSSDRELPEQFGFILEGMHMSANADYYKRLYDFGVEAFGATDDEEAAAKCVGKYGFSPEALADLGYKEQNTSMTMYMRQDGANFGMDMSIGIEQMWNMDIELDLEGDMKSQVSNGRSLRPTMSRMSVTVTDRSINQRSKDYCRRLGLSEEETLQANLEALEFFGKNYGIVFDDYILDPYKEFLGGKSTFRVTAHPNNPVNLSQLSLYKPSDVPALLNLEAVAE